MIYINKIIEPLFEQAKNDIVKCSTDPKRNSIQNIIGIIGETIIENVFSIEGFDFKKSDDWWDSEKDGIVNGKKYEVKTQVPFYSENAFSIPLSQFEKLSNVDITYFVEIPLGGYIFNPEFYRDLSISKKIIFIHSYSFKDKLWLLEQDPDKRRILYKPKSEDTIKYAFQSDIIYDTLCSLTSKLSYFNSDFLKNRQRKYLDL